MIGELTGKIVGQRGIHRRYGELKIEKSMESKGKILGMDITFIATVNGTTAMGLHAMIALFQGITGQTVKRS